MHRPPLPHSRGAQDHSRPQRLRWNRWRSAAKHQPGRPPDSFRQKGRRFGAVKGRGRLLPVRRQLHVGRPDLAGESPSADQFGPGARHPEELLACPVAAEGVLFHSHVAVETADEAGSETRGFQRLSPPEPAHALLFSVAEAVKKGADAGVLKAWKHLLLTTSFRFEVVPVGEPRYWRAANLREEAVNKGLMVTMTIRQRIYDIAGFKAAKDAQRDSPLTADQVAKMYEKLKLNAKAEPITKSFVECAVNVHKKLCCVDATRETCWLGATARFCTRIRGIRSTRSTPCATELPARPLSPLPCTAWWTASGWGFWTRASSSPPSCETPASAACLVLFHG